MAEKNPFIFTPSKEEWKAINAVHKKAIANHKKLLKQRSDLGRFKLIEAARHLVKESDDPEDAHAYAIFAALVQAVLNGELQVYEPNATVRYRPQVLKDYYEEVYWCHLNAWLEKHHKRLNVAGNFPRPPQMDTISKRAVGEADDLEVNESVGVPTQDIVTHFKLKNNWHDKLRHVGRNPFLKTTGALIKKGNRKSAHNPGSPNLWNPAKFAEMLIDREKLPRKAMATIIQNRFPNWLDTWEALQDVDEPDDWFEAR